MSKIDLHKDKIRAPFKAPDAYFEELTGNIQERISVPAQDPGTAFQWKWVLAPAMVLIVALTFYFYPTGSESDMDQMLADVTDEQIEAYLELSDISEYELAQLIDDADGLMETNDFLEGIELNEEDLENFIIDLESLEQGIGS
tara:strand:- start:109 stop:537 length:429 start_codon:yes stop_codon:yes gene_type:complete